MWPFEGPYPLTSMPLRAGYGSARIRNNSSNLTKIRRVRKDLSNLTQNRQIW